MRAPLGNSLGRHLLAAVAALAGVLYLHGTAEAQSCIPGFDYAAFAKDDLKCGLATDSYDSSLGPYIAPGSISGADLGTAGDCSKLQKLGSCAVGGNIAVHQAAACTGAVSIAPPTLPPGLTAVTIPTPYTLKTPADCSNCTMNSTGGNAYRDVTTSPTGTTTVGPGTYVITRNLDIKGNFVVTGPGPTVLYLECLSGYAINIKGVANTGNPANLLILGGPNCINTININGGASSSFALYAPNAHISLNGSGEVWGSIVGKSLTLNGGGKIHYDKALKNVAVGNLQCAAVEISRATPIIADLTVIGEPDELMVQGTYESPIPATRPEVTAATVATLATWQFPYIPGHLRARKITGLSTAIRAFNAAIATGEWDGATGIPAVTPGGCASGDYTPGCRTVFTNAATGLRPPNLIFSTAAATRTALAPLLKGGAVPLALTTAQDDLLITRILSGGPSGPRLGGLDRSTVAVIPPSLVAGAARPTIAYVGGTDGMLHAFCMNTLVVSGVTKCTKGKELWAFVPRTLLPDLRLNRAIIDGSPRVVDMFGNFDGLGGKFRTILTFTTGTGVRTAGQTPAVYALDITDPNAPKVVWEYTWVLPSTRLHELGHGQTLAQTVISVAGVKTNVVYAQTNNGQSQKDAAGTPGTGAAGTVLTAINAETGAELYAPVGFNYPSPTRSGGTAVPYTGVPGGAVSLELARSGFSDAIVFGTLYGDMWVINPLTGTSKYGSSPLFRIGADGKPIGAAPTIYKDTAGVTYAVGVTGGYWDRSLGSTWGTSTDQNGFAVRLGLPASTAVPLTDVTGAPNVPFVKTFTGLKLSSQALVVGNEVFFGTESGDINAAGYASTATPSGSVSSFNLTDGNLVNSDATVVAGVGSLAKSTGGGVYASGARGSERISFNNTLTTGQKVDTGTPKLTRRLWLRTL